MSLSLFSPLGLRLCEIGCGVLSHDRGKEELRKLRRLVFVVTLLQHYSPKAELKAMVLAFRSSQEGRRFSHFLHAMVDLIVERAYRGTQLQAWPWRALASLERHTGTR